MKKFPTNGPRMNQSAGMTANFLEATGDGQDYEDDEELVATERGRSSLQRRGLAAEEQVNEGIEAASICSRTTLLDVSSLYIGTVCLYSHIVVAVWRAD